jgi:hypothetical protein
MMDGRLGRKPALNMRLFDHTGRPAAGPIMSLDHRRAKDAAEAYAAFLTRVEPAKGLFAEVRRGWQQDAMQEGDAA